MQNFEFNERAIQPVECVKEAWALIKDEYWILFAVSLVGALIGGISMYVLIGAMICGIFKAYLNKIDGHRANFEDLWKGFNYFTPSLLVTIAVFVPAIIWTVMMVMTLYLPLIALAIMGPDADPASIIAPFVVGLILDLLVGIVMVGLHTLLIFSFPLIVDRELSAMDAIKLSARAAMKNVGGIAGLFLVNLALVLLGYAALCIGLYLMIPIITATHLVAYRKVFPRIENRYFEPPPISAYGGG